MARKAQVTMEAIGQSSNRKRDFKEECLTGEDFQKRVNKTVLLKNGALISTELALILLSGLRSLLENEPEHFKTLLAVANGDKQRIDQESTTVLRSQSFLDEDNCILQSMRDVLLSAYQETKEGPIVGNPFRLLDLRDARALEGIDKQRKAKFLRDVLEKLDNLEEKDQDHSL